MFLMGVGLSAQAQLTPINETDYKTTGHFKYAKELWMCSSNAVIIDMALEAFGVSVSSEGEWYELIPGEYIKAKDASLNPLHPNASDMVSTAPVSNIFNVTGRGYGVYEFLYKNKTPNFCGMVENDQAIFRIYIVPELTGFSVNTQICEGVSQQVDLTANIPVEVKNFANKMGWTFDFLYAGNPVTMPLTVSTPGLKQYTYTINDNAGNFAGKYDALTAATNIYKCSDYATVSHSVSLSTDAVITPPDKKELSYCLANLKLQYPTTYELDLNGILNFTAPNGKWGTTAAGSVASVSLLGVATIQTGTIPVNTTVTFEYEFDNCDGTKGKAYVELTFGDDTTLNTIIDNQNRTVCRNFAAGEVSLLNLLGLSVPSTAGTWINPDNTINHNGQINLAQLNTGRAYAYQYNVSTAAANDLCNITNYTANLVLTVDDVDAINSGQAQICKSIYDAGTSTINLGTFVLGLPSSNVTWSAFNPSSGNFDTPIADPTQYPVNDTSLVVGINMFKFEYSSVCGHAEGKLYLTVTDRITNYRDKELKYCVTDVGAYAVNLEGILSVAGLQGTWIVDSSSDNVDAANFDGKVFNGSQQYLDNGLTAPSVGTFIFRYQPVSGGEPCIGDEEVTLTIIITPDIVS